MKQIVKSCLMVIAVGMLISFCTTSPPEPIVSYPSWEHHLHNPGPDSCGGGELIMVDELDRVWVTNIPTCDFDSVSVYDGQTWSVFSEENSGLSGYSISNILTDGQGNVWFLSGEDYITVFDGEEWQTYTTNSSDFHFDVISRFETIAVDPQGRVWVGFLWSEPQNVWGPAISMYDGETWTTFSHENSSFPAHGWIWCITFDKQGRTWVGMSEGFSILDDGDWINYSPSNSDLIDENVRRIDFDLIGRAWLHTHRGLQIFDGASWITFTDDDFSCQLPLALSFDDQNVAWIGSCTGSVLSFDGSTWIMHIEGSIPSGGFAVGPWGDSIVDIEVDHQGRVWVASGSSVKFFDGETWTTLDLLNSGLVGHGAGEITVDRYGNIWFENGQGVSVFKTNQ